MPKTPEETRTYQREWRAKWRKSLTPDRRAAHVAYLAEWRARHPHYSRDYYRSNKDRIIAKKRAGLAATYGVTEDQWARLASTKSCEACGVVAEIVIDHDHATGLFRGLLCRSCNTALGMLRDDSDVILGLHRYLTEHVRERAG